MRPFGVRSLLPGLAVLAALIAAPTAVATPSQACAADRPCMTRMWKDHEGLYFEWENYTGERYTHYNVRWSRPGRAPTQFETRDEAYTIGNAWSNTVYTVAVQGCRKPVVGRSTCTPWESRTFRTK